MSEGVEVRKVGVVEPFMGEQWLVVGDAGILLRTSDFAYTLGAEVEVVVRLVCKEPRAH